MEVFFDPVIFEESEGIFRNDLTKINKNNYFEFKFFEKNIMKYINEYNFVGGCWNHDLADIKHENFASFICSE